MSSSDKFNLTFEGEIRPGLNLTKVKVAFARALTIEDAKRVDAFFSGEVVTLRRHVDKATAEAFYTKMYRVGAILTMVPADSENIEMSKNSGMDSEFHNESPGQIDQSWPIPSQKSPSPTKAAAKKKPTPKKRKLEVKTAATNKPKIRKKRPSKAALAKIAEETAIQEAVNAAAIKLAREADDKATAEAEAEVQAQAEAEAERDRLRAEEKAKKESDIARARQAAIEKQAAEETERLEVEKSAALAKAKREMAAKKAAEDAARLAAKKEAKRKKLAEEAALKKAIAAADREKARREAAEKKAAEEAALAKAAEQAKKLAMEKEAARLREEYAENKRIAAAIAAKEQAERHRKKAERKVSVAQQKLEDAIATVALLEREAEKAQTDLKKLVVAEAATKQSLTGRSPALSEQSLPLEKKPSAPLTQAPPISKLKRQPGAPNFFSMRPFRATASPSGRAEQSSQLSKIMFLISAATTIAFILLLARTALLPKDQPQSQMIKSIVVGENSQLSLAAASQLFILDRAGLVVQHTPLSDYGLDDNARLLRADGSGTFIVQALQKASQSNSSSSDRWLTLECELATSQCKPYNTELGRARISSWIIDTRTKNQFVAIPSSSSLLKLAPNGQIIARASATLPKLASLQLSNGLLYITGAEGAAIGVFKPDNTDFGEQLDEIIVQPPKAISAGQTLLDNFAWAGDAWWVLLRSPDTSQVGLYRFDQQWNSLGEIALTTAGSPQNIIAWAGKILLLYGAESALQRFSAEGQAEAPIVVAELQSILDSDRKTSTWMAKLWRALMVFLAITAMLTYLVAQLFRIKRLIDKTTKYSNARPLDDLSNGISWVNPATNRNRIFRLLSLLYAISCGLVFTAIFSLQLPTAIMLSAGIALIGPAALIAYLWHSPTGHLGLISGGLILVDHNDTYHVGAGSQIHYRSNFLLVDDVLVFKGSRVFPVFDKVQLQQHVLPQVVAGVKVDRKTLWIKLVQSRHPLANGLLACLVSFSVAALCVILL